MSRRLAVPEAAQAAMAGGFNAAWLDDGSDRARLHLFTNARPAAGAPAGAAPAVTISLAKPSGLLQDGRWRLVMFDSGGYQVASSGAPTWGRLISAAGAWAGDGDAGDFLSDAAFSVSGGGLYAGGYVLTGTLALQVVPGDGLSEIESVGGLVYDSRTARPIVGAVSARFQQAGRLQTVVQAGFQQSTPMRAPQSARWRDAVPLNRAVDGLMRQAKAAMRPTEQRYQDGLPAHGVATGVRYQDSLPVSAPMLQPYQRARPANGGGAMVLFEYGAPMPVPVEVPFQRGLPFGFVVGGRFNYGRRMGADRIGNSRFQDAIVPPPGLWQDTSDDHTCYVAPAADAVHLRFHAPHTESTDLVFICERAPDVDPEPEPPGETIVVPIRRTYMTINTLELHRVDTGQALLAYGFTLTIDADSWTWSWSATLRADALSLVQRAPGGDPVMVEAVLNGKAYRFLVERVARDTRFASSRLSVSGRGLAAILAAPFAPSLTHSSTAAMTAQQLMANVLTINGVELGWDLDWELDDWPVPAGAWTLQGSYMDAVVDIAAAAGGYVQPHATEQRLRILPRYPAAPWDWSTITPDIELPVAPVALEATEWVDKPAYNRVFVGGTGTGVFGPLTRAGTAGDLLAPQVNHPLITDVSAWRQRGRAELASGGRQAHLQLTLQVLPETGLILPGKFIRYLGAPGIGIVRSTSYDWSSKRQTIGVETHVA